MTPTITPTNELTFSGVHPGTEKVVPIQSSASSGRGTSTGTTIVGVIVGVLALIAIIIAALVLMLFRRRKSTTTEETSGQELSYHVQSSVVMTDDLFASVLSGRNQDSEFDDQEVFSEDFREAIFE
jgi:hypothetical protein